MFKINMLSKITPKSLNPFGSIINFIANAKLAALIIGIVLAAILVGVIILIVKKSKKK